MNRNRRVPVIPFDAHYDESEIEYIKHERVVVENNEERDKIIERVPRLSEEAEPFEILRFLAAFARAREDLAWTTGPKLYQKFRMHLTGYPLELWDTTIFGNNRTVATFNVALNEFKNELLQGYHYEDQLDYLREVKKPGKMTPTKFLLKLKMHNKLVTQLPGFACMAMLFLSLYLYFGHTKTKKVDYKP